jgi:hypothetical protein
VIPPFTDQSYLPAGIHGSDWDEVTINLGFSEHRRVLLKGLYQGLVALKVAGCQTVYINGSFVSTKVSPDDIDVCYELDNMNLNFLESVFSDFSNRRARQKARFSCEFFPANAVADVSGRTYLDFFQRNPINGELKGIIALDLRRLP